MRPLLRSPSPIRAEPCIRGHYVTPSSLLSVTHWDCSLECQEGWKLSFCPFLFFFFPLYFPVSVSASEHITPSLSVQLTRWHDAYVYRPTKHRLQHGGNEMIRRRFECKTSGILDSLPRKSVALC